MFTGVSNDLPIALQYLNPVASFFRYAKHPMTNDPMLKIHSSPLDDEVLTVTSVTPNVPAQYSNKLNYPSISVGHKYNICLYNIVHECCTSKGTNKIRCISNELKIAKLWETKYFHAEGADCKINLLTAEIIVVLFPYALTAFMMMLKCLFSGNESETICWSPSFRNSFENLFVSDSFISKTSTSK